MIGEVKKAKETRNHKRNPRRACNGFDPVLLAHVTLREENFTDKTSETITSRVAINLKWSPSSELPISVPADPDQM